MWLAPLEELVSIPYNIAGSGTELCKASIDLDFGISRLRLVFVKPQLNQSSPKQTRY